MQMKTGLPNLKATILLIAVMMQAAAAAGFAADAAAPGTQLSLAQAIEQARGRNPQVAIEQARVAAADGLRIQAGLLPNPVLTVTSENEPLGGSQPFSFSQDTDDYAYLGQTIELGGKRGRRIEVANTNLNSASIAGEIAMRELIARVATAYWTAVGSVATRDLYERESKTIDGIVEYSSTRVRKGATAEADLLRIELESDRLRAHARLASADADRALIELYRLMGDTDVPKSVAFTDSLDNLGRVAPPEIEAALRDRPELRLAREQLKRAQANLDLQRANAISDPDLMIGYKRWSGFNQYSGLNTLFFGVKIPLPLFSRNQGQIAAAEAAVRSARSAITAAQQSARAEIAEALADYEARRDSVIKILPLMNDHAAESYAIARGAYRLGGADLLRFLDAERVTIESRLLYVQALTQYHQSVVALQRVTGMLPGVK
jgi:cobalt-zinc-cadmium efflux system outer membrane protein